MATLTTNISNVSISVSGSTTQTATISWTAPTIPAGATINSCTLTGSASSFTTGNKGATLTINGTSVSSGSSFTLNLGNNNSTTSVTASFKGNHKQTNTSVTLSNLVYTVNYTEPVVTYTVTFKDWDGSVLKTQTVESGKSATAPSNPSREGYEFTGWDKLFNNITSDLTVTAQYEKLHVVTFKDYNGTILKIEYVANGGSATAPNTPNRPGYSFTGWSVAFTNVTSDIITIAQYVICTILSVKENGSWTNVGKIYKRLLGVWVEQNNTDWESLLNVVYSKKQSTPIAYLYSDGTLIFYDYEKNTDSSHGDVAATYTGWDAGSYSSTLQCPWESDKSKITKVCLDSGSALSMYRWFYHTSYSKNIIDIIITKFDTSKVINMHQLFYSCSSLINLDLSNFNTSKVTDMSGMFKGCTNLKTIYVKDETAKTKIEASSDFPSTATVIIGKPN